MQESKKLHLAEFNENFLVFFFLKPLFNQNTQNIVAGKCFTELVQNQIQLVGKTKNILNFKTIAYLYFITCF